MREDTSGERLLKVRDQISTAGDIEPVKSIVEVEYQTAISRGPASFVQLAKTYFYAQEKCNRNPHERVKPRVTLRPIGASLGIVATASRRSRRRGPGYARRRTLGSALAKERRASGIPTWSS